MSDRSRQALLRRLERVERQATVEASAIPWGAVELDLSPEDSEIFDAALRAQGFDPAQDLAGHSDRDDGSIDRDLAVLRAMGVVQRRRMLGSAVGPAESGSTISTVQSAPRL